MTFPKLLRDIFKQPLSEEERRGLESVASQIRMGGFDVKKDGLLSKDGIVSIHCKGHFERSYGKASKERYIKAEYSALTRKDGKIGDGKNWYDEKRLDSIVSALDQGKYTIRLRDSGNSPAIIDIDNAEIWVAPFIM